MPSRTKRFGWTPDLPDHRDHLYAAPVVHKQLPAKVDLRPKCPKKVYDQEDLGSCTANAIAAAVEFDLLRQQVHDFMPSRLFIYYNEREMEGTIQQDAGAMIRDGVKSVNHLGVPHESRWPYSDKDPGPFLEKPAQAVYTDAAKHKITTYQRIPRSLTQMKGCLASGFPFLFGFSVYTSFQSQEVADTGKVSMPSPEEELVGGHAVLCVGYDDHAQRFIVRNSWGPGWGMGGYFTMPYTYLLDADLSDDFWTLRAVSG